MTAYFFIALEKMAFFLHQYFFEVIYPELLSKHVPDFLFIFSVFEILEDFILTWTRIICSASKHRNAFTFRNGDHIFLFVEILVDLIILRSRNIFISRLLK